MTYIPTECGFMRLEDSAKLLRAVFPNYPDLTPCLHAPALEALSPEPCDQRNADTNGTRLLG